MINDCEISELGLTVAGPYTIPVDQNAVVALVSVTHETPIRNEVSANALSAAILKVNAVNASFAVRPAAARSLAR